MFGQARKVVEMAADTGDAAGGGELRYAGFWARVAAQIVDSAIVAIVGLVLIVGASFAGDEAAPIAVAAGVLVALLYWPLLECSARQATFGKQLLGIQVTDMEGGRLSFVRSLLRNLAKIVSSIPLCIGFLLAGFTVRKQALHDMIVSCLVVRSGPSHLFKAVAASVVGLIVIFGGLYYYDFNVNLPQLMGMPDAPMQKGIDKAIKGAQPSAPAAKPSAPVPAPQPATATPPAPQPVPPVAVVTPEAPPAAAPAPAPAPKPAAVPAPKEAAPAKPAAVEAKPAPAEPAAAELVSEPPADKPRPARRTAAPRPLAVVPAPVPAAPPRPPAVVPAPVPAAPPRMGVVVTPKYNDVMTAVMYRDAAAITQLLDLGWWVDRPDTNGLSPLMAAAWNGDAALVELLLQRGADPNRRARGGSVLEYAGRSGDGVIIEMLKRSGAR